MSERNGTPKKGLDSNVIAAIVTVIGGIITTLIVTVVNRPQAPVPTPIPPTAVVYTQVVPPTAVPTDSVPLGDPTSTAAPETSTPEPIPTVTLIPAGADWLQNCISAVWGPYPSSLTVGTDDAGCRKQPIGTFYTTTGRLAFSVNERVSSAQIYGLFVKLPPDGTVNVDTQLTTVTNGEVLMGVFEKPDIDSNGALVVIPESKDVTKKQLMILKTMPGQREFSKTADTLGADPPIYSASFDFNPGNIAVRVMNGQINLNSITVVSSDKWLFLGYQVFNGTNVIQAEFLNLNIQSR
jgi:hypothetical protein